MSRVPNAWPSSSGLKAFAWRSGTGVGQCRRWYGRLRSGGSHGLASLVIGSSGPALLQSGDRVDGLSSCRRTRWRGRPLRGDPRGFAADAIGMPQ